MQAPQASMVSVSSRAGTDIPLVDPTGIWEKNLVGPHPVVSTKLTNITMGI